MNTSSLGRLKKVELRQAWLSESAHFTPWLAREENLKLLSETIGLALELDTQEKDVGPFRADILCRDVSIEGSENWVLIENQLERTDHCHLGQLLTYAAGLKAVTIVWIAERFTEEHRAALDWLNERTDENINFFGLEIELWQIGESEIAPKFNLVSKPNEWSRTIQQSGKQTELRRLQQEFWAAFVDYMEKSGSFLKCTRPRGQHWMVIRLGKNGFKLSAVISTWNSETNSNGREIRAEFVLSGDNAKRNFSTLEQSKTQIEAKLDFPLHWYNPSDANKCKAYARIDADFFDRTAWNIHFTWLRQHLEALHKVFVPLTQSLSSGAGAEAEE